MLKFKNCLIIFLFGIPILIGGCGPEVVLIGAASAGTIAYIRGDLESTETKNIEIVYSAALLAAEQLELRIISKSKDALSATIIAYDAQEKRIQIKMNAPSEYSTKISIRVGTFGSETKSHRIYQRIYNNMNPVK
jgi:hypothetical protein